MKLRLLLSACLVLAAGCDAIPKDPESTLDRVRAERRFKVGMIVSPDSTSADRQRLFIERISSETGAQAAVEPGAAEPLLGRLETGALDLVVGPMGPKSPWSTHVTFLPPLVEHVDAKGHLHIVAMARNGENAWIGLLHRHATAVAAMP